MLNQKLPFSLYFMLLAFVLHGQDALITLTPNQVVKDISVSVLDLDFEEISTVTLYNGSDRDLQLQWSKKVLAAPSVWETLICSKTPNYAPFQTEANNNLQEDKRPFRLGAGQSLDFYLILRPNGTTGKGTFQLAFADITQAGRPLATATFDLEVSRKTSQPLATNPSKPKTLRIFPNPAIDNFFVEMPSNKRQGKVEVINTLGRKLKTFTQPAGPEGYDIKDLPEGIYLINIYDETGKKLKTLRLLHRRFGA
ncbi:MAG: T9SS type A sorting domain-containing protein [Bacteroidota bacterium]